MTGALTLSRLIRAVRLGILLVAGLVLTYLGVADVLKWRDQVPAEVRAYELVSIGLGLAYLATTWALGAHRQLRRGLASGLAIFAVVATIVGYVYVQGLN